MLYKLTINSKSIFYLYNLIIYNGIIFYFSIIFSIDLLLLLFVAFFFFNKYIYFTYFSFSFFFFEKKTSDKSFVILSKIYTFSIFHDVYIYISKYIESFLTNVSTRVKTYRQHQLSEALNPIIPCYSHSARSKRLVIAFQ